MIVLANKNVYLNSVGLSIGNTAANVQVYNGTTTSRQFSLGASDGSSGTVRTFSNPIPLIKGQYYWIEAGSGGGSYTQTYNSSAGIYPITKTNINFINDAVGLTAGGNTAYNIQNITTTEITSTFNPFILEGSYQTFSINISLNATLSETISNIVLNYSDTIRPVTLTNVSTFNNNISYNTYSYSQIVDLIGSSANNISVNVSWIYNVSNINNLVLNTTTNDSQKVYKMIIGNCAAGLLNQTLNVSATDYQTNASLTVNYSTSMTVWADNGYKGLTRTYGFTTTNQKTQANCLFPTWASLKSDYIIDTLATNYASNRIIHYNAGLTNDTTHNNIFLMNAANVNARNIIVQDDVGKGLSGYSVNVYRYNIANGLYDLVGSRVTDVSGITLFYLVTDGYQYRVNVINTTNYDLATVGPIDLSYTPLYITIQGLTNAFGKLNNIIKARNIVYTLSNINTTRTFTLFYNDVTNVTSFMCLQVWNNNTQINQSCSTQKVDTLQYTYSSLNGSITAYAVADITGGSPYVVDSITTILDKLGPFGTDGGPLGLLVFGTMTIIGALVMGAPGALVLGMLAMIVLTTTGLLAIYSSTMAIMIVVFLIVIIMMMIKSNG